MSTKPPIPVLLTAIGGGGHGEQILKALRLADPGRYRVYGADANPYCPQFDLVEDAFTLPSAGEPHFLEEVLNLCRRIEARALFHGCEPELRVYARERGQIEDAGIFLPVNPLDVINTCMDKIETARFLAANNIPVPRFVETADNESLTKIDFFPVIVKPAIGGGGSANCYIAQDEGELKALSALLHLDETEQRFMVQEYIGTPEEEYTVGILHDMDGVLLNSIALRRSLNSQLNIRLSVPNRTGRAELGNHLVVSSGISHGYVDRFPEITKQCERIASLLGARGPLNIQCRVVDGTAFVFEINPRFSGTTSIRALMGFNEPDLLLRRHLYGETIEPRFDYENGWVLRSLAETRLLRKPVRSVNPH